MTKPSVPAVDGWFSVEPEPHLIGTRCASCGTYFFPPERMACRNPSCSSTDLDEVELSRRGKIWSYGVNHYAAPAPFVASDPFEPYAVAAVELPEERMVVLGQVAGDPNQLKIGDNVELTVEPLFEDDEAVHLAWKWRKA